MEEETKSKIWTWIFWIVILAGLGYCAKTGIEDSKREEAKRQEAQKERKASIAAMEQKALVIQNELLNTHHASKFNVEDFGELEPKFTLKVSNLFRDKYPGNILFKGSLQDISVLQEDKYVVHIGVDEIYSGNSLDIFVVCPKNIVDKISLDILPNQHFYESDVFLVAHITRLKKIPFQFKVNEGEGFSSSIRINRSRWQSRKGNFIAEGTCVDLMLKPSKNIDPIDPKLEKIDSQKKQEQSNLPDIPFNDLKIIEESYGKGVRIFENTGGEEPSRKVKEKIALDLLNKLVEAPGPVRKAINSVLGGRDGHLDIPTSLSLVTYARGCNGPLGSRCSPNGGRHSRILYRATLTWEECCIAYPGGFGPEPILDLYILQTTKPQPAISNKGGEERLENSILTTQIFGVRECAENSLICDVSIPIDRVARAFDCDSMFPPNTNAQSLAERFGEENVVSGEVYLGEGDDEKGTVLFGGTKDQVDILWKDVENQRKPRRVSIERAYSSWMTQKGLLIGADLLTVEKLNQTPFRLMGFLSGGVVGEGAGTQVSWSGGALESEEGAKCHVRVRLMSGESAGNSEWYRQVQGDREYASGHPAMQALNPHIVEIRLEY